jgi:RNA exonuclease 4
LFDKFIRPEERVTGFLSEVSGVTPARIKEASTLKQLIPSIEPLLKGKIVVGHTLHVDLEV